MYKDVEKVTAEGLITFLKKHASKSLNLPIDAHIPEDLLDQYYEEKAQELNFDENKYLYKIDLWLNDILQNCKEEFIEIIHQAVAECSQSRGGDGSSKKSASKGKSKEGGWWSRAGLLSPFLSLGSLEKYSVDVEWCSSANTCSRCDCQILQLVFPYNPALKTISSFEHQSPTSYRQTIAHLESKYPLLAYFLFQIFLLLCLLYSNFLLIHHYCQFPLAQYPFQCDYGPDFPSPLHPRQVHDNPVFVLYIAPFDSPGTSEAFRHNLPLQLCWWFHHSSHKRTMQFAYQISNFLTALWNLCSHTALQENLDSGNN